MNETLLIGNTITVTISSTSGELTIGTGSGHTLFVYGDGSVGDQLPARIIHQEEETPVCITSGAELRLRVDKKVNDEKSIAYPTFGPVYLSQSLTEGDWYKCHVTAVETYYVEAKAVRKIPSKSDIESGSPPDSPAQSLNHLINNKHNDS
jgi:hypothetical protein